MSPHILRERHGGSGASERDGGRTSNLLRKNCTKDLSFCRSPPELLQAPRAWMAHGGHHRSPIPQAETAAQAGRGRLVAGDEGADRLCRNPRLSGPGASPGRRRSLPRPTPMPAHALEPDISRSRPVKRSAGWLTIQLAAAAALVALADFLFYDRRLGISLALFLAALALISACLNPLRAEAARRWHAAILIAAGQIGRAHV